ncbi:hypothetical protein AKJ53_00930 [candidate division MSBL1 archaeon SCGC-AAA382F02]|uniref:Methyltransferase type 11 domain-containing protein n=1 Tax=candidate division MSBL1 archaeon SCGC-AAA382F02 TaxID=1698282 RepID=A0A133VII1_9EURY|nr:hypothetical protein AKJ53_00930 [candidate division MSBL1 archaeon SCGC-AAA382F02]
MIEHLSNPGKFLESAKKHLKKDGKLVLTTPNLRSLYLMKEILLGKTRGGHVVGFTEETLRNLLKRHGGL